MKTRSKATVDDVFAALSTGVETITPRRKNKATVKKKASTIKKPSIASKTSRKGSNPKGKRKPNKPLDSGDMPPDDAVNYKLDVVFGQCMHSRKLVACTNWFRHCSDRAGEIFLMGDASSERVNFHAREIVQGVRDEGGRFFKHDPDAGSWVDVGDVIAVANTCSEIRDSLELLDSMKRVKIEASPTIVKKKKRKSGEVMQMERACDRLSTPQRAQLKNLLKLGRGEGKANLPSDVATSSLITIPDFPDCGQQTGERRSSASTNATSSSLTMPTIDKGNFSQKLAPRSQPQPMEWSLPGLTTTPESALAPALVGLAQDRERSDCSTRNSEPKGGKDCKTKLTGKTESVLPPTALVRQNSDTLVKLMRETSLAANDANNHPYLRGGIPAFLLSPIQLPSPSFGFFDLPSSSPSAAAAVTEMPTPAPFFSGGDRENAGSFPCNLGSNRSQGEESKPYSDRASDPVDLPLELPAINTTVSQDISDFMNSGWKSSRGRKSI